MVGRIYVGDHWPLLHTKYMSYGPHGFREEDSFKVFPIISLWELMTPQSMANLDPRGFIDRIYVGDH